MKRTFEIEIENGKVVELESHNGFSYEMSTYIQKGIDNPITIEEATQLIRKELHDKKNNKY